MFSGVRRLILRLFVLLIMLKVIILIFFFFFSVFNEMPLWKKHVQRFLFCYRYTKGELDIAYITSRIIGKPILSLPMDLTVFTDS